MELAKLKVFSMILKKWFAGLLALSLSGAAVTVQAQNQAENQAVDLSDPENTLYLDLETGRVTIQLRPDKAPNSVERIRTLVRRGFYDGLIFHRVIPGFMAQGGDPAGNGSGGSELPDLKAEFSDLLHLRGTMAMARADSPDSANSQFYITFSRISNLDNKYTIIGRVVSGMEHVDALAVGEPPVEPSKIIKMSLASDSADQNKSAQSANQ
ncbi:hypothetical protein JCM17846_05080 [Iodidimonas nitroreducens]|uniref:Peptidyl-prolyl cis-trans isomerase n=1 Tax=Iodidimonas nitroreducens TaxID=1236968 RepID=A0A5A7N731_9PROT|nr:peptidylprolyl isomerase [Iodidimonas nitroreducens]GER02826.1 hypothetical protein JCM17846_05080 [Iodidimonas nitroreducens]